MQLLLNGEPVDLSGATIAEILIERGLDPGRSGIAVAINGEVIPRASWNIHPLNDGDDIEVITAMQGG